jgi:hypothetical protein
LSVVIGLTAGIVVGTALLFIFHFAGKPAHKSELLLEDYFHPPVVVMSELTPVPTPAPHAHMGGGQAYVAGQHAKPPATPPLR